MENGCGNGSFMLSETFILAPGERSAAEVSLPKEGDEGKE